MRAIPTSLSSAGGALATGSAAPPATPRDPARARNRDVQTPAPRRQTRVAGQPQEESQHAR